MCIPSFKDLAPITTARDQDAGGVRRGACACALVCAPEHRQAGERWGTMLCSQAHRTDSTSHCWSPPGAPRGRALARAPLIRLRPPHGHPSLRGQWQGGSPGQESSNSTGSRPCWAAVLWVPAPGALPPCRQLPCKHSVTTGPSMPSFPGQVPLQKSRRRKGIFKW